MLVWTNGRCVSGRLYEKNSISSGPHSFLNLAEASTPIMDASKVLSALHALFDDLFGNDKIHTGTPQPCLNSRHPPGWQRPGLFPVAFEDFFPNRADTEEMFSTGQLVLTKEWRLRRRLYEENCATGEANIFDIAERIITNVKATRVLTAFYRLAYDFFRNGEIHTDAQQPKKGEGQCQRCPSPIKEMQNGRSCNIYYRRFGSQT